MLNLISRFVDSNDRNVKRLKPIVEEINSLEAEFQALTDEEIRARMIELRDEIREDAAPSEPSPEEIDRGELRAPAELRRAREKEDIKHLQHGPRRRAARGIRGGPRGQPAQAGHAALRCPAASVASCCTRARSPR